MPSDARLSENDQLRARVAELETQVVKDGLIHSVASHALNRLRVSVAELEQRNKELEQMALEDRAKRIQAEAQLSQAETKRLMEHSLLLEANQRLEQRVADLERTNAENLDKAEAWRTVFDTCMLLGMDLPMGVCGLNCVTGFIRGQSQRVAELEAALRPFEVAVNTYRQKNRTTSVFDHIALTQLISHDDVSHAAAAVLAKGAGDES